MALHLDDKDVVGALAALLREEVVELLDVESLDKTLDIDQLAGVEVDERVEITVLLLSERAILGARVDHISRCCPAPRLLVDGGTGGI